MRFALTLLALATPLALAQVMTVPPGGNISITLNHKPGDSDEVISNIPLPCLAGCSKLFRGYLLCNATEPPSAIFCPPFCSSANYTGWTECLNCIEANGATEFLMKPISQVLDDSNKLCASAVGNSFTPVSTITASPTTTAPLRETFTESNSQPQITITPWEGLASYADPSFWASYGRDASSTIAPSASGSSGAATTSGAAGRKTGKGSKAGGMGVMALVLGLAMA